MAKIGDLFEDLAAIVARLRDPNGGCPWDLEQTHESLKPYLIEEAYEVIESIENNREKLGDELGDVLLQVMLHSQIASEDGRFSIENVINAITAISGYIKDGQRYKLIEKIRFAPPVGEP